MGLDGLGESRARRWPGVARKWASPDALRAAWQAFEAAPGARYLWRKAPGHWAIVAEDGSEAASVNVGRLFRRGDGQIKIGDRHAYDISPRSFRHASRVTDAETGELVLTITGSHHDFKAGTQFTFEDGRVVQFPAYAGTERDAGRSARRWRLVAVMFADDSSGTQPIARFGGTSPTTTVVRCSEPTPERLLVAVLAAPLIVGYTAFGG
jgi:hypothetical protein